MSADSWQANFDAFMVEVDARLSQVTQGEITSHEDFEDYDYSQCFDNGISPQATVKEALAAAGWMEDEF